MASPIVPPADARLTLVTLGAAELRAHDLASGTSTHVLGPGKPVALLAYLTLAHGRAASRERLLDLLWADQEPERGRAALRQTLWHIKRRVGYPLVQPEGDPLELTCPLDSDHARFLDAADGRRYADAVAAYPGDFLPRLGLTGGAEFELWAERQRQHLRGIFLDCAEHVVRAALASARFQEAIGLAKRVRELDPLAERGWRLHIEALATAGDRSRCLTEAAALELELKKDGYEPEPATRALIRRLTQMPGATGIAPGGGGLIADLVGRSGEFALLVAAWDTARGGATQHMHVVGAAGIGKSRLLLDLERRLRLGHGRVVAVRANAGDGGIPYALLAEIARMLAALPGAAAVPPACAATLVALNPVLTTVFAATAGHAQGEDALRHRTIAVHALIAAVADEAPIAILVDDMHWADEPSRQALAGVVDRLDGSRALVVTAARPHDRFGATSRSTRRLVLSPLPVDDIAALVANLALLPDAPWTSSFAGALYEATGGSPLLVLETLQLLIDRGVIAVHERAWQLREAFDIAAALGPHSAIRARVERLEAAERQALAALALAGRPIDVRTLATAIDHTTADAPRRVLDALERHGFIVRGPDGWQPAHDEIADVQLALLTDVECAAMHRRLAAACLAGDGSQPSLLRAGRHLVAANARDALRDAFRAWVTSVRATGDGRSPRELAVAFGGEGADPALVRWLAASMPLHQRHGWRVAARATAAAVLFLAVLAMMRIRPGERTAAEELLLVTATDSNGQRSAWQVGVRRDDLARGGAIDLPAEGGRPARVLVPAISRFDTPMVPSPDGSLRVGSRTFADSGGNEIAVIDHAGHERRLTHSPGDDIYPAWSPDGARIAFSTSHSDSLGHLNVAVLDVANGRVRSITSGVESDHSPIWRQDGLRIGFLRRHFAERRTDLCVTDPDGGELSCIRLPDRGSIRLLGWHDRESIVAVVNGDREDSLVALRVTDGASRLVTQDQRGEYRLSPDGRWVACRCENRDGELVRWRVFPLDRPDLSRDVELRSHDARSFELQWLATPASPRYVDRVNIEVPVPAIPVGAGYLLRLTSRDASNRVIQAPAARWSVSDTTIATVRPDGLLVPKREGRLEVTASVRGWRQAHAAVEVVASGAREILREDWKDADNGVFTHFGVPEPIVVADPHMGSALWGRGDDSHFSGVFSTHTFDASRGLGVEVHVSIPLTMTQWQLQRVELTSLSDMALADWDRRTGWPPRTASSARNSCMLSYPDGEDASAFERLELNVASHAVPSVPAPPTLRTGAWFRLRIQLLPDGRCAFALDGRPVAVGASRIDTKQRYRIMLHGSSFATRVLLGPVRVWAGLESDIDWRALDDSVGRDN